MFPFCSQEHVVSPRRSSTCDMLTDVHPGVAAHMFDKVHMECEFSNLQPLDTSCLNTSAVGSGLDSDFGASAGLNHSPIRWHEGHSDLLLNL